MHVDVVRIIQDLLPKTNGFCQLRSLLTYLIGNLLPVVLKSKRQSTAN